MDQKNSQTLEYEILKNAVDACARETGLSIKPKYIIYASKQADAGLIIQHQGIMLILNAEVKPRLTTVNALLPQVRASNEPEKLVMVTSQVTERMADRLRAGGIQFMDEAGNIYLNQPGLYVFVKGKRNLAVTKPPAVGRAFKTTGLQLIFLFLCKPELLNQPYRSITAQAGVALGMVNWVMHELKELGFLEEQGMRRNRQARLINKEALLERWLTGYTEQLRPKLVHGRYQGAPGWWDEAVLDPQTALWGGELAADKLTGNLKPQDIILYVDRQKPNAFLLENKLRKDPQGNVTLLYRFWNPEVIPPNRDMVHPLLVYADLMATGDQRNLETTRQIYEQYILQLVRQD